MWAAIRPTTADADGHWWFCPVCNRDATIPEQQQEKKTQADAANAANSAQNTVTVEQVKGQGANGGPFGFDHVAISVDGQQAVGLEPKKDTAGVVVDETVPGAVREVDPNREVKDKATIQVTPDQARKIQTFLDNSAKPAKLQPVPFELRSIL